MVSPLTGAAHGTARRLEREIASFARHLRAANLSPKTIGTYLESTGQFAQFVAATGRPATLDALRREDLEAFIEDLLGRHSPATARNRYAGLQTFFRWAIEEELIDASPMARMRPPKVPEQAPAILREPELKALLRIVDADRTFAGRRDAAILRVFIDTGARRAEVANLHRTPADPETRRPPSRPPVGSGSSPVLWARSRASRRVPISPILRRFIAATAVPDDPAGGGRLTAGGLAGVDLAPWRRRGCQDAPPGRRDRAHRPK